MTYPQDAEDLDLGSARVRLREPLFVSWILALGVLPIERWELVIAEVGPGLRFVEESRVLTLSRWRHERSVEPAPGGSVLTDRLAVTARLPGFGVLLAPVLRAFFAHRHRRLVALFGALPA